MTSQQIFFASASATVKASTQDIWAVLEDVNGWANWDQRLDRVEYTGAFQPETVLTLFLTGNGPNDAKLKTVSKNVEFSYETCLPNSNILNRCIIEKLGCLVKITWEIEASVERSACASFSKRNWPGRQIGLAVALKNLVSYIEAEMDP